jgi:integrase
VTAYKYCGSQVHDFRRSAARQIRMAGVPENVVMDMMGHKTRSIFTRYDIINPDDRMRALDRLDAAAAAAQQNNAKATQIGAERMSQHEGAGVQKLQ